MPQQQVCDLVKDQRFEGFLLVRSSDQRTGGNGAKYLDMNLADRTGEVNAKVWDGNVPPPAPGSVVKVHCDELNMDVEYKIVGSQEADPMHGRISEESPFGRALMGQHEGATVVVEAPAGQTHYTVLSIS